MAEELIQIEPNHCPHYPHSQTEPHTCPYKEDIDNDSETLCTCCEECEQECSDDI